MPRDKEPRRPEDWSATEKLEAVIKTSSLGEEELGAYLRAEGLHGVHLEEWRQQAERALGKLPVSPNARLKKENQRLEKELRRKDKALAETAALLVLSKKVRALWGDEGDIT